jgi:hypothetical protein
MAKKAEKYPRECPTERCFGWGLYWLSEETIKRGNLVPFPVTKQGAEHKPKTIPCPACGASAFPNGR